MVDYLLGLWSKNKWLFWLLIPFVIVAFGIKIYQEYQFAAAKKSLEKTRKKSEEIKKKVAEQEKKAQEHIDSANESQDRINARNESNKLNLDWHKKKDDK